MSDEEEVEAEPVKFPHRVDLPGGGWADIRSPRLVTRRARKPIKAAWNRVDQYRTDLRELSGELWSPPQRTEEEQAKVSSEYVLSEEEVELYDALNEPLTVALVEAWSYAHPISIEGLNELPADAADALILHCAPFLTDVFVDMTPSLEDDSPT